MNQFPGISSETSALSLRRRSVWEAADSGILLWRSNFSYFIPFFAIPVWAVACGLRLLPANLFWLSYLLLWWLKPFFDRLVLHVVSRKFFDSDASGRFGELHRGLAGTLFRGLLGDLLWRRFSLGRCGRMPVRVLEQISSAQFRQRKKTLAFGGLNFSTLVTVIAFVLEIMLLVGEIVFVVMLAQLVHPSALDYIRNNTEKVEIFIFAAFCLNYILVESLYVCMGFGLYINSRIEVEGWDLQLLFQKFAGKKMPAQGIKTALMICLLVTGMFLPLPLSADQIGNAAKAESVAEESADEAAVAEEFIPVEFFPPALSTAPEESLDLLNEILASPDFGYEKEGWRIKFKYSREPQEVPEIELSPWFERIRHLFGIMLRFIVVLVIAATLGFAFYWVWKFSREGNFRRFGKNSGQKMYQNPLLSSKSPEYLFSKAEEFFSQGLLLEAWAACLSGCLGSYAEHHSISFPADATEYDCLNLVNNATEAALSTGAEDQFGNLIQNWIFFAYGSRTPAEGAFEKALVFGRSIGQAMGQAMGQSNES